jgi:hypothetical protein
MRIASTQAPEEQEALLAYIDAKRNADQAILRLDDAEAKLLAVMESKQRKTLTIDQQGIKFSATYTQRTTNQIDEAGLRKALTAKVFDKFTVRKLDRKALEQAMSEGAVDPMVVAKYVEQVPGKKFLTYREREEDEAAGV